MKNIHVLPTDKPSRLHEYGSYSSLGLSKEYLHWKLAKNIYITSDEEIKEGDWFLDDNNSIGQSYKLSHVQFANPKKIILTTDFDKQPCVQTIDDEFLEWFVKNPNCENVEVVKDKKLSSKNIYDAVEGDLVYSHHGYGGIINSLSNDVRVGIDNYIETAITSDTGWETLDINNYKIYNKCYKIIIPSEEIYFDFTGELDGLPNLSDVIKEKFSTKEEPKQEETLEEVAERLAYDSTEENKGFPSIKRFIEGAKFQQKRSYSEEEVMNILYKHTGYLFGENKHLLLEEWFEQFKKK